MVEDSDICNRCARFISFGDRFLQLSKSIELELSRLNGELHVLREEHTGLRSMDGPDAMTMPSGIRLEGLPSVPASITPALHPDRIAPRWSSNDTDKNEVNIAMLTSPDSFRTLDTELSHVTSPTRGDSQAAWAGHAGGQAQYEQWFSHGEAITDLPDVVISQSRQISGDSPIQAARETVVPTPKWSEVMSIVEAKEFKDPPSKRTFRSILKGDKQMVEILWNSVMGGVVLLNALAIGISYDSTAGKRVWIIVDSVFAGIFLAEVLLKLKIHGWIWYFLGDAWRWNYFELALVVIAVLEIVIALLPASEDALGAGGNFMALVRIVRLSRISRLLRLLKMESLQDLTVMVQGTLGGMKTLVWSTVLIMLPVYILGLVLRETLGNNVEVQDGAENFQTLPIAIFNTYRCLVVSDCSDAQGRPIFALVTRRYGFGFALIYCGTTLFMTFGLFNVIVSIFIENVLAAAKSNQRILKRQRIRDKNFFAQKMTDLVRIILQLEHEAQEEGAWPSAASDPPYPSGRQSTVADIGLSFTNRWVETDASVLAKAESLQITPELFEMLKENDEVSAIFSDLDLADDDQFNLFETLDADGGGTVDMEELFAGITKLRGEAKKSDLIGLNFMILKVMTNVEALALRFEERTDRLDRLLTKLRSGDKSKKTTRNTSAELYRRDGSM